MSTTQIAEFLKSNRFVDFMSSKQVHLKSSKRIAYFSMGSGIFNSFLTYSGGLEILAGDMIKEIIDVYPRYRQIFIQILWKKGYSVQRLNEDGSIVDELPTGNAWEKYVEDTHKKVSVKIFGNDVTVKIWKLKNGPVYYLDTDLDENHGFCNITHRIYGGSWDDSEKERIAQEIVLGVGGVRAIEALGLEVDGYHYNDGHPAFAGIELISKRMKVERLEKPYESEDDHFEKALEYVKKRTAFTTHTNVPAGNESHSIDLLMEVGANVDLTYDQMAKIGDNPFGMTVASLRLASKANGVSRLQVEAAKEMWKYVDGAPDIIAITNGVHKGTWQNAKIAEAYYNNDIEGIYNAHQSAKETFVNNINKNYGRNFKADKILIVFARRATEYKRWTLIARDMQRLEYIIKEFGVQFVFSGKAHPHDGAGKGYISEIYKLSKKYPDNIIFIEGYDIAHSQEFVAGGDVWLNNPRVLFEACGTSGMKAAMNGTLNVSTPDGWCREGVVHGINGWLIGNGEYGGANQDDEDAKALMDLLIDEVLPTYYNNKKVWKNMMYASIVMSEQYSAARMVEEYYVNMYNYLGD